MTDSSTEVTEAPAEEPGEEAHDEVTDHPVSHVGESEAAHHPKPSAYVGVAIILALVTAAEVGMYYMNDLDDWVVTTALIVMMALKFFLVAMWFMHLRFEAPIFRRLFYGGLGLAIAAYAVFLGSSRVFPWFA